MPRPLTFRPRYARPLPCPTEPALASSTTLHADRYRGGSSSLELRVGDDMLRVELGAIVVAGFTGRDRGAVRAHADELAAVGVPVPAQLPSFYALPPDLVTQADTIEVVHGETSGEVEIVLIVTRGGTFVTLGSDHTDRVGETKDIGLAKHSCPKVVARAAWAIETVAGHWDELEARSWITEVSGQKLYQDGIAAELMAPDDLLARIPFDHRPDTFAVFCGTFPALGGIRAASNFMAELRDPVLGSIIDMQYEIRELRVLAVEAP